MSQATDYAVANASGAAVRADINSIFAAVASANSGTAEPSTMYSFMIWVDTTNNVVKLRNGANDAWLTMPFSMTASNTVDINGGTVDGITSLSVSGTTDLDGAVTINESSADVDFRVESNGNANMLFVDGGNDRVGIGGTPDSKTHIYYTSDITNPLLETYAGLNLEGSSSVRLLFGSDPASPYGAYIQASNTGSGFSLALNPSGGNVGIGTDDPQAPLHARNGSSGVTSYIAGTRAIIEGTATTYLTIASPTGSNKGILFADSDDSDAGYIAYDSTDNLDFGTAGSQRMRLNSSGNLLVGTTTFNNLSTESGVLASNSVVMARGGLSDHQDACGVLQYANDGTWLRAYGDTAGSGYLIFRTGGGAGSGDSEAMRIDSSGRLLVGITSTVSSATQTIYNSGLDYGLFIRKGSGDTGTTNKYIGFDISGGGAAGGSITNASTGNAQFTATSDERLKENIEDVSGCLDIVMALKPSSYTLKESQSDVPYGFIAQNVETVLPEFVSEDDNGWKQISDGLTSGYMAVLTKAIQELSAEVEKLKQQAHEKCDN